MELFIVIVVGFVAIVAPGLAIIAATLAFRARSRIEALEARLARLETTQAGAPTAPGPLVSEAGTAPEPFSEPAPESESEAKPEPEPEPKPEPAPIAAAAREGDAAAAPGEEPAPPPRRPGLEERLGARWAVWVGGLALALGGLFLVRFSLQEGLLGPGARVTLAFAFALALLGVGEWMRRRPAPLAVPGLGPFHLPAVLTAAGAASAFGATFAAYAVYGFIGPLSAVVALGLIAVATMLAAALHGPLLAPLGLLGAFGAPILIGGGGGETWPLPPYFAAVALASYGVARLRGWPRLSVWTAILALVWALALVEGPSGPAFAHVVLQTALAAIFLAVLPYAPGEGAAGPLDRRAGGLLAAFALVSAFAATGFASGAAHAAFAAAMTAALLAAALRPPAAVAAGAAFLALCGILLGWPVLREAAQEPVRVFPGPLGPAPTPEAFTLFIAVAAVLAAVAAAFALERMTRLRDLRGAPLGAYAAAFAAGPLLVMIVVYWRVTGAASLLIGAPDTPFAVAAALLGVGYLLLARRLSASGAPAEAARFVVGAAACGALASLALGLAFQLERGMLTVAFALSALGAAFVADRTGVRGLRYGVGALGLVVLARLAWDPTIMGGDPGRTPVFNWLLWGYGVPALAFFGAARLLDRGGRDRVARLAESLAIVFAALLVFFQIRHLLNGGDPLAPTTDHLEIGLVAAAGLGFSFVATRVDARRPDIVTRAASVLFALGSLWAAASGLGFGHNPLFTDEPLLGGPLFNSLAPAYLLPAALAGALALAAQGVRPRFFVVACAALAFAAQFLWLTLAIRAFWLFPRIGAWRGAAEGELWAYSAALMICGLLFLGIGLARRRPWLRLIGAVYFVAAILKVFLVDLAGLEGVMRALSFIALGLALVVVGLVYQKFLSGRAATPHPD